MVIKIYLSYLVNLVQMIICMYMCVCVYEYYDRKFFVHEHSRDCIMPYNVSRFTTILTYFETIQRSDTSDVQ